MGLLSFLRKKPPSQNNGKSSDQLGEFRAQAYQATQPSLPPVRGNKPVAGNGQSLLQALARTQALEAYGISRPGGGGGGTKLTDDKLERPRTAPSSSSPNPSLENAPPLPVSKGPPWRLPSIAPESPFQRPSPLFGSPRPSSIHSSRSGLSKGFVDLLDARSSITPTDHRDRLQAAGARNYGEDVADRNVGANGINLDSAAARAFYATSSRAVSMASTTRDERESPINKRHSFVSHTRTRSMLSESHEPHHSHASPRMLEKPFSAGVNGQEERVKTDLYSTRQNRRLSMPVYTSSSQRKKLQAQDAPEMPATFKTEVRDVPEDMPQTTLKTSEADPKKSQLRNQPNANSDSTRRSKASRPSKLQDIGQNGYRSRSGLPVYEDQHDVLTGSSPPSSPELPNRVSSRKRASDQITNSGEPYFRTRTVSSLNKKSYKRVEAEEAIPERNASLRHLSMDSTTGTLSSSSSNPFRPQSRHSANTSVDLVPFVKDSHVRHGSYGGSSYHAVSDGHFQSSRTGSMSASKPVQKLQPSAEFNMDDYVSSDDDAELPRSSNVEGEDLLFHDSKFLIGGAELPGLAGMFSTLPRTGPPLSPQGPVFRGSKQPSIDSYHRDPSPANANVAMNETWIEHRRRLSHFRPPRHGFGKSDGGDSTYSEGEDADSSDSDDMSFDIPMSRREPAGRRYRISRYTSREIAIEEEREQEKVDISSAFKMRKEAKKMKRMSGIRTGRHEEKAKETQKVE